MHFLAFWIIAAEDKKRVNKKRQIINQRYIHSTIAINYLRINVEKITKVNMIRQYSAASNHYTRLQALS